MKARNLLMMFVLVLATGAACSSGSQAERDDETAATQESAQTEAEATEQATDEEMAEADTDAEGEMAEGDKGAKKGMMEHCPMEVEGTKIATEQTEDGIAMVFTTTGDVDELRERVQWMAKHHNKMSHGKMKGHGHAKMNGKKKGHAKMEGKEKGHAKKKGHDKHAMMAKSMPQATVTAEEVDQGMKLVFTAEDDAGVETLQKHISQHVEQVNAGECPMKYNKSKKGAGTEKS